MILRRGMVYVDRADQHWRMRPHLRIPTPFGTLSDLGTQFVAQVDSDRLIVGVRQGSIVVISQTHARRVSAGNRSAAIARIDTSGRIRTVRAQSFGGLWSWVPMVSRGFVAAGHSVGSYLRWLGREHGYTVRFNDAGSEVRANALHLRGDLNLEGLSIAAAAALISDTTNLDVRLDPTGTLHVGSDDANDTTERRGTTATASHDPRADANTWRG